MDDSPFPWPNFLSRGALATTRPTAVLRPSAPSAAATGPCGPWLRHLDCALGSWKILRTKTRPLGVLKWATPNSSNFFMGFSINQPFWGTPIDFVGNRNPMKSTSWKWDVSSRVRKVWPVAVDFRVLELRVASLVCQCRIDVPPIFRATGCAVTWLF